jgi:hypothetical protein
MNLPVLFFTLQFLFIFKLNLQISYRIEVEMLHVSQGIQKIWYRKEEKGFILTNSSIGLVENAVKEDILNRWVQPAYLP